MTLLDLSLVTSSLLQLIKTNVQASPAWPAAATLDVSPEPPDQLAGENVIGFYLYHLAEDPHHKNVPPRGNDHPPVRFTPMGLQLYYQLTAHCDAKDASSILREQLMMGLAVKTLHDYACIDDRTQINGNAILVPALQGADNRLRVALLPVMAEQSVEYWTAGSSPLRLAAYYMVSVVLLEPEETRSGAGRVLRYGVFTFTSGAPRLLGSRNTLSYTVPGETGARQVELRPAQVPIGGQVTFFGTGLAGDETTLLLKSSRWDDLVEADPAWGVVATGDQLLAKVQPTASAEAVLPGVYSAVARVTRRRTAPGGLTRDFTFASPESPFVITPRVDALSAPTAAGVVTVTGTLFSHPDLPAESVQVIAGEERLEAGAAGALNVGEFAVVDASTLELRLPAGLAPGSLVPIRIFVNGAESPPSWVVAP